MDERFHVDCPDINTIEKHSEFNSDFWTAFIFISLITGLIIYALYFND